MRWKNNSYPENNSYPAPNNSYPAPNNSYPEPNNSYPSRKKIKIWILVVALQFICQTAICYIRHVLFRQFDTTMQIFVLFPMFGMAEGTTKIRTNQEFLCFAQTTHLKFRRRGLHFSALSARM